ncbi:hypothetical protein CLU79DRAFT_251440 [Phycomyces nitens]|nr:hypothetical protein CLU79DRAFT_251440 [Phycomyces nitens]
MLNKRQKDNYMFPQLFSDLIFGTTSKTSALSRISRVSRTRSKSLTCPIKLTLEELYTGKITKISLQKHVVCPKCNGTGDNDRVLKACQSCNGCGVRSFNYKAGSKPQSIDLSCNDCHGMGSYHGGRNGCTTCVGRKTISKQLFFNPMVEKGARNGQKLSIPIDTVENGGLSKEIIVIVQQVSHPRFKRLGDNLIYDAHIDLTTALSGGQIAIPHLDDRVLLATVDPREAIVPNCVKVIPNQGMPIYNSHNYGHLFVKFTIDLPQPDWATPDIIAKISALLPPSPPIPIFNNKRIEQITLFNPVEPKLENKTRLE